MCNSLKFSDETFYQAIEYTDTILSETTPRDMKYDLIAIGCLLLAGILF